MPRLMCVILILLALSPLVFAGRAAHAIPDAGTTGGECYAKVGPLLQSAGGKLTPDVRNAYLEWAEQTVLQQLRQNSQTVPESCLAEVRRDGTLRDALFGSVFPPDPSIVQNYAQLRAGLGEKFLAKYRSLVVAISVAKRIKGVEKADLLTSVGRDYQPGFWVDESLQSPGSDPEKAFVRCLADFLKQSQAAALDLYQDPALQEQARTFLTRKALPADWIALVRKSVWFGERLRSNLKILVIGYNSGYGNTKTLSLRSDRHPI